MFNRPPVIDMRDPEMREAEFQSNYVARVFGLKEAFTELSNEFKGIVPPGEVVQVGRESWMHRTEKIDSSGNGNIGSTRAWRYLALTSEGLRVVEEERLSPIRGEESMRRRDVVGAPNLVTAMRLGGSLTPGALRERVTEVVRGLTEK
ncbi:MAG: hypothetical protein RL417_152 [Pseudomonadota bacterium]|jgi:hypothetical protein